MKLGEFYRHKWNKYISKVIDISLQTVTMQELNSGVVDTVAIENFNMNYAPCCTIHNWEATIRQLFKFADSIQLVGDSIKVNYDGSRLVFRLLNDKLIVSFSDDIKDAIGVNQNDISFHTEYLDEILKRFADLFE